MDLDHFIFIFKLVRNKNLLTQIIHNSYIQKKKRFLCTAGAKRRKVPPHCYASKIYAYQFSAWSDVPYSHWIKKVELNASLVSNSKFSVVSSLIQFSAACCLIRSYGLGPFGAYLWIHKRDEFKFSVVLFIWTCVDTYSFLLFFILQNSSKNVKNKLKDAKKNLRWLK